MVKEVSQEEVFTYCIKHDIPFVISKFPGKEENVLLVSATAKEVEADDLFKDIDQNGFVIAPFCTEQDSAIYLNADYLITNCVDARVFKQVQAIGSQKERKNPDSYYAEYEDYVAQYKSLYHEIEEGKIVKAILSRIKRVANFSSAKASEFYNALSQQYPKAYTFMFYTPQTGLWAGASPELFFKTNNQEARTVSLAGTRKVEGNSVAWDKKEKDEQQIVTDFVKGVLRKHKINHFNVEGPLSIQAGKMSHLKTMYSFSANQLTGKVGDFIQDLHPTPAVCGLPKAQAMKVILHSEKHQRSFYAGFLGRVARGNMEFYVNIRSMKFVNGGVDLYLGGGITKASKVEEEWTETELKAQTLLDVISNV